MRVALRAVESARQAAESGDRGPRRPRRPPPDRQGPRRPRDRRRLPAALRPARAPLRLRPRHRRLPRRRSRSSTAAAARPRRSPTARATARRPGRCGWSRRCCCCCRRASSRSRVVQRLVARAGAAAPAAAPRLRRRHPRRTRGRWWSSRRSSTERRRRRRSSSSTSRCWRSATSTRTSTSRSSATSPTRPRREMPEDAAILAARARASRPERRPRPRAGDRFYPLPPRAPVEPGRERVDGLGAQARQDRGVQPPAARRHRHELRRSRSATSISCPACATASPSTPTPACRATPPRSSIGIIAHPLNRPRFDRALGRVTEGYGILQPRVSVTMASAAGSLFARLYAGHTGVDPYTTAVSDTYQDLFGEGIFTGKGLYDVDAFMAALEGRVPENALLSHDLFEGLYARTALVTDVEVVDDYPSSVLAHARRQHRWVRGDWQILRWLFPWVPTALPACARNRLPLISRWKIFDNLRRSLVAPATVALLLARLDASCRDNPAVWTAGGPGRASPSRSIRCCCSAARRPARRSSRGASSCARVTDDAQTALGPGRPAAHLPRQPAPGEMLHAIGLTLVRLAVTQRRLLEWETAAASAARAGGRRSARRASFLRDDGASPLIALVALVARGAALRPAALAVGRARPARCGRRAARRLRAEPPGAARRARARRRGPPLPRDGRARRPGATSRPSRAPRTTACRPTTSRRSPEPRVAAPHLAHQHRHGAARDARRARPRLHRHRRAGASGSTPTLTTMEGLERYEGHLLNWYDTRTPGAAPAALRLHRGQRQPGRRADDARRGAAARPGARRPRGAARRGASPRRDELPVPLRPAAPASSPSATGSPTPRGRAASTFLLRPAGLGGAAGELHRHRQGRRAADALVPPRAGCVTSVDGTPTLLSWSGTAVRVPDAAAVHAQLSGDAARPSCRMAVRAADRVRGGARRALGHLGVARTTSSTATTTTSTRRSASPASG